MANVIKLKNSGTANSAPTSLEVGELAVNYADGKIYYKNTSNAVVEFAGSSSLLISNTAPANTNILWADTSVTGVGVVPVGGTTGQVLAKSSSADYDAVWAGPTTSFRNMIINGAMQVAQRGTSTASITTDTIATADRWTSQIGTLGTWTNSVENDAPTGSGFRKSWKWLCTTADASPAAGDYMVPQTRLEGQNLQAILKGTSSAQQLTLTFWVKSNVTGTYVAGLFDVDNTRIVSQSYTVSASATWEKKTITFPADTTGAFDNDENRSLDVQFWLAAGTSFSSGTLQTTWAANTNSNRAVGQTNLAAATSNYWQITGVQLEAGAVATPFEQRPIGVELALCQRYYETSYIRPDTNGTVTTVGIHMGSGTAASRSTGEIRDSHQFMVEKRATPTVTLFSNTGQTNTVTRADYGTSYNGNRTGSVTDPSRKNFGVYSGDSGAYGCALLFHFVAEAEL